MIEQVWNDFLNIVRVELGSRIVETWFKAVTFSRYDMAKQTAYIAAPNSFVKEWIQRHYKDVFDTHLCRLLNIDSITLVFVEENVEGVISTTKKSQSFTPAVRDISGAESFTKSFYKFTSRFKKK